MTTPYTRRIAAVFGIGTIALATLAGCDRRQPEVPTPSPSSPMTPSPGSTTTPMPEMGSASAPMDGASAAFPPASAASQ